MPIIKRMVWEAYQLVALNGKAAGVDGQSLENLRGILETTSTIPELLCVEKLLRASGKAHVDSQGNGGIRPLTFWSSRTASRRCWSSSIWNPVLIPMKSRGDSETTSPTFPI
ncbi:hypothetical protein ACQ5SK_28560 [Bradyrhizobium japonicum]